MKRKNMSIQELNSQEIAEVSGAAASLSMLLTATTSPVAGPITSTTMLGLLSIQKSFPPLLQSLHIPTADEIELAKIAAKF
jgi:hypothetical protein